MKRILCILLAVLILLSLPFLILLSLPESMMSIYEDTNGDADFSLQTLTDQDIIQGTSFTKVMSSTLKNHNKTVCKARTMSGVEKLWEERLENETLDIIVSCEITKGNAQLVLVIDDKIVHTFAVNEVYQRFTLANVTGKVYLKLAGENAGYIVTYELN